MSFRTPVPLPSLRAASRSAFRLVRDANAAQRALFDDVIRLDRVAGPDDLPRVPLRWRQTLGGWRLEGTVLPGGDPAGRPCGRSC